jgi:hypothetical protein
MFQARIYYHFELQPPHQIPHKDTFLETNRCVYHSGKVTDLGQVNERPRNTPRNVKCKTQGKRFVDAWSIHKEIVFFTIPGFHKATATSPCQPYHHSQKHLAFESRQYLENKCIKWAGSTGAQSIRNGLQTQFEQTLAVCYLGLSSGIESPAPSKLTNKCSLVA